MSYFLNKITRKWRRLRYGSWRHGMRRAVQVRFMGNEFLVWANEDVGWRILIDRVYEQNQFRVIEPFVRQSGLILDVGANIGVYSIWMAKRMEQGEVHAFEPNPLPGHLLQVNMALNSLLNISVMPCALGEAEEAAASFSAASDSAYSSLRATNRVPEQEVIETRVDTLDGLYARNQIKVDFIKLDVEGAELLVLKGGTALFRSSDLRPRALLVEFEPRNQKHYDYVPDDIVKFMSQFGYRCYSITSGGLVEGWPQEGCDDDVLFIHEDES